MKKWMFSAIALTMSLHCPLRADNGYSAESYPQSAPQSVNESPIEEPEAFPDNDSEEPDTTEEIIKENEELNFQPTPPVEVPPLNEYHSVPVSEPDEEPVVEVGRASSESADAISRQRWQRVAIAAGAVAIATIALILVGQHKGRHAPN